MRVMSNPNPSMVGHALVSPSLFAKAAATGGYLAMHTNPPGGLAQYYRENVIGGPGAFVVQIDDFRTFGDAMMRKLVNEISDARPPG